MQENNDKNQGKNGLSFESLDILIAKWKDGTFSEIIDDWKWIFSYSVRYKWAIVFYTILGIFSTSMGLVSSVAGKYLIDIITGYKTNKLMILIIPDENIPVFIWIEGGTNVHCTTNLKRESWETTKS